MAARQNSGGKVGIQAAMIVELTSILGNCQIIHA